MSRIPSYGKVWAFGHRLTRSMVGREVVIEEKVDGSQFSAMVDETGRLHMRSKEVEVFFGSAPNLFAPTVDHLVRMAADGRLGVGVVYRGEAMRGPKHNSLTYKRAPRGHFVLFDVDRGREEYLQPELRELAAEHIEVEPVPVLFRGVLESEAQLKELLARESFLGGIIEGVVIKPIEPEYDETTGKRVAAKYVSEAFKETHRKVYKPESPTKLDAVARVVESVSTPARWEKAVQRLRESGALTESLSDIGPLMNAVSQDILAECRDDMAAILFDAFRKEILRRSTAGIPQWWKDRLAKSAFEADEAAQ